MRKKYVLLVGVVIFVLLLDQIIKVWVKTHFTFDSPSVSLIGQWLQLNFVENQGMAFGTQLGGGKWGKLLLSSFRIVAILAIVVFLVKQIKKNQISWEFIVVGGLVLAGAMGNLFDSMFYDYIFSSYFDPCISYNQMQGSGLWQDCHYFGLIEKVEVRHTGFLFGNVVDMFQFNVLWPSWMPWLGGQQVFPAIWNIADGAISVGMIWALIRQKTLFPKKKQIVDEAESV